jgi:hypothetical protein
MAARKFYSCLMIIFLLIPAWGNSIAAAQPGSRYFPATGYTVAGTFLAYWTSHGGVPQLGLPISHTYIERNDADGNTYCVQYFERARLEYHPEQSDPKYQVMLGLVGVEAARIRYPHGVSAPTNGDFSIMENDNDFIDYWGMHNENVGFPITFPFDEQEIDGNHYRVRYFERARLERHRKIGEIMLGLVGSEVYHQKQNVANAPACTPGP